MKFIKGEKVRVRTWDEIIKTLKPYSDHNMQGYQHKTTGLILIPEEFLDTFGNEYVITEMDHEGDYMLKDCFNFYHADWLQKIDN